MEDNCLFVFDFVLSFSEKKIEDKTPYCLGTNRRQDKDNFGRPYAKTGRLGSEPEVAISVVRIG